MTNGEQEHDRIIAECTETLEAAPDDVMALLKRGRAWHEKRGYGNAIADFDDALGVNADRVEVPRILNARGLAFSDKGEQDLAITDFTQAILCGPSEEGLPKLYYNRGRSLNFKGAHDSAIQDFTEAIRLDPQHADAYGMRGLAWQNIGDYCKAIADYNLAIRNDPESADAYHNRGNAWVYRGKLRKAIADFTQAIRLDPKSATSYNSRGSAWRRKGRWGKALADLEQALELEPHSADRRRVLAAYLAVCPQRRCRDGTRAVQLMTEACEITDYKNAEHLIYLAAAYAERGDFPSAIAILQKALPLATTDDEKNDIRFCDELYKAGEPWRMESPSWRQRWA
ncbi:Cellulose synthase operon protein C precursor [Novipirellula aureliae]|uniref:Cellulose synthase operon protein C n=1 Tax=Novipirellula aureliae TaxID=2527966 RepID=A0A5C6DEG3_9BACT|nr:tetratricopeptide repeat protein [Novipirellula aureliae]TWU35190.1 Cellulose synthase operon protein C precursor [Novipirellula aureliae]